MIHIAHQILFERSNQVQFGWGKLEGKRTLGRPRRRWKEKHHNESSGSGTRSMHSIDLAQDKDRRRAGDTVINLRVQ